MGNNDPYQHEARDITLINFGRRIAMLSTVPSKEEIRLLYQMWRIDPFCGKSGNTASAPLDWDHSQQVRVDTLLCELRRLDAELTASYDDDPSKLFL
jgi:hypothetical protein